MKNNPNTAEFMRDLIKTRASGQFKKDFFQASFKNYFNSGEYFDSISRIISELQNASGNIPENFISFYAENKDLLYKDIKDNMVPRLFLADYVFIHKYNLDENDIAKSIYSQICYHFRIPE